MKSLIKKVLNKTGFDIVRLKNKYGDPYFDMTRFTKSNHPMIFDVGANTGQTIKAFREYFRKGTINSFEPNSSAFAILEQATAKMNDVHVWNKGLGSTIEKKIFYENSISDLSSFLKQDEMEKGVEEESMAEVTTIDQFCEEQKIKFIDILKVDTQGFELEILKGAETLISNNGIGLIYLEVIFSKLYKDSPSLGDLYNFLSQNGYNLVSIYQIHYQNGLASWTDLLFVHDSYKSAGGKR